jgi:TPR repeat protein
MDDRVKLGAATLLALLAAALAAGTAAAEDTPGAPQLNLASPPFVETERLADNARAADQTRLAFAYVNGTDGYAKDGRRGCRYAEKASLARPDAMHLLGDCYRFGWGGEQNAAKAEKAYGRARSMGYVDGAALPGASGR